MIQWSIRNRILFMALLPGVLVSLVLGVFFIAGRANDLNDLLEQRALAMAKQLAPTCEYGVMTGSLGILQNIANSMLEEQDVRAVNIYDQEMNLLAHSGPRMLADGNTATRLHDNQLQLINTQGSLRVKAPIFAQNLIIADQLADQFYAQPQPEVETRLLGWAEIELSTTNTRLSQYQHLTTSFLIILAALIIGAVFAMRISRQLSEPVKALGVALNDIKSGNLDARIHVRGQGELQELATGVNAIATNLQRTNIEHQQALEQSSRESQETIDELEIRNHELKLGQERALQASRTKSEFLANVSHEIRTPLNGIIGFSELLARTQVSDRQGDYVRTIHTSSIDLMNIIDDILDLSKLEAGKLILDNSTFNLRELVEEVIKVLVPGAHQKGIRLYQYLSPELPEFIKGDRLRLKQVLTNLLSNAVKFTHDGGVSVHVQPISQDDEHVSLQFDITDTGIGMNDEQVARLFHAFSQADPSISRQYGGTGLGLVITKGLIEAMRGDIRVTSEEGHGSTFSFTIDTDQIEDAPATDRLFDGMTIAIINDSKDTSDDTTDLLSVRGANISSFHSTGDFLRAHDEDPADALVLFINQAMLSYQYVNDWFAEFAQRELTAVAIVRDANHSEFEPVCGIPVLASPFTQKQLYKHLLSPGQFVDSAATPAPVVQEVPTVLAVDDNEANLKLVVTLLNELGVKVLQAPSGYEAIVIAGRERVDLVLMDIQMPGMSGTEATVQIRKIPGRASLPVVALTAHAMSDERQALIESGLNDYQTKPVSQEQLAEIVERWTGFIADVQNNTPLRDPSSQQTDSDTTTIFSEAMALHHANGNAGLAVDMFQMLLSSLEKERDNILEYWENEALDELLVVIHTLHGAARYCGVPALRAALEHFETTLKANKATDFPDAIRQVMTCIKQLQHWAEEHDWGALLTQRV